MKLSTIWSLESFSTLERLRLSNVWAKRLVARKLPRDIRYLVTLNELGKATKHSDNVPATTLSDVLKHLEGPKKHL